MKNRIDDIHFVNWRDRNNIPIFMVRWSEYFTILGFDFRADKKRKFQYVREANDFYWKKIVEKKRARGRIYGARKVKTMRFARMPGR
jgi:hypothetical protein